MQWHWSTRDVYPQNNEYVVYQGGGRFIGINSASPAGGPGLIEAITTVPGSEEGERVWGSCWELRDTVRGLAL
jgi:hypothetical protein